jgi:type VII secretion-associated serine protease mycosin
VAGAAADCGPARAEVPPQTPWQLRRLDPAAVWHLTRGQGVTVAVLDSGVSTDHPVLRGKVATGRDFALPDFAGQCDQVGHGTIIAGIIAGRDGTGVPFTGIAPEATILPGRVFADNERINDPQLPDRIAAAIVWAVDTGADVINMSFETPPSDQLREAVAYAHAADVVLVAAAGNIQQDQVFVPAYPAAYEEVLAVAGVAQDGTHVESSGAAGYVDIAAPGADIIGPAPRGDGYLAAGEGTSFAAGYVSGVAALVRAYRPDLSAGDVVQRLLDTADRPPEGRTDELGYGVVNPYRAVATVLGSRENVPVGEVAPAPAAPDPRARHRAFAGWAALGGAVLTVLLLLVPPAIRRGRRRRWRPARSAN